MNRPAFVACLVLLAVLGSTVCSCATAPTMPWDTMSGTPSVTVQSPRLTMSVPVSATAFATTSSPAAVTRQPGSPTPTNVIAYPIGGTGPTPYPRPSVLRTPVAVPESTGTPPTHSTPLATPTVSIPRYVGPGSVPRSPAFAPATAVVDSELDNKIRAVLGEDVSRYGVVVKRLTDGRGVGINPDQEFYAASLFKAVVMYEVYKQRELGLLSFEQPLQIIPPYMEYQLGDQRWELWDEIPIGELLEAMITESDNVAAVMLLDKTGGWNVIADFNATGLTHTNIDGDNMPTSAGDMALWLEMIGRGQAVDKQTSREMIDLLSRQKIDGGLRTLLPADIVVAHKTGTWDNATHDVGIVYAPSGAYVIAVLSDKGWDNENITLVSKVVFDHFEGLAR